MIRKAYFYRSVDFLPYHNQALEEYFLDTLPVDAALLYLWQNRKTVVIGKNQNHLKECRVSVLESDGGYLARRLSGGGAVYHDEGNLNFTFITSKANYSVERQLEVMVKCLASLGIAAHQSGRNDLVINTGAFEGRKFSGNAYYQRGERCLHHGTIMLSVDPKTLMRYLTPSTKKLEAKGVNSVRSRVVNLQQLKPELTVEKMAECMADVFFEEYALPFASLESADFDAAYTARIEEYEKKFASPSWKYGQTRPFVFTVEQRFSWGEVEICLSYEDGKVVEAKVFSDALDGAFIEQIAPRLLGADFSAAGLAAALEALKQDNMTKTQEIQELLLRYFGHKPPSLRA